MEAAKSKLIAVIGDEDTVTGFLLAGIGSRSAKGSNFLVVDKKTTQTEIETTFKDYISRSDIGIVLINQHVANGIRHLVNQYDGLVPTVLEIPSKEHPYDPSQDHVLQQVNRLLGFE